MHDCTRSYLVSHIYHDGGCCLVGITQQRNQIARRDENRIQIHRRRTGRAVHAVEHYYTTSKPATAVGEINA